MIMSDEWGRMWKEAVVAYFNTLIACPRPLVELKRRGSQ